MGLKYPIDFKVAFSAFDATINMLLVELVLLVLHLFTQYHGPN